MGDRILIPPGERFGRWTVTGQGFTKIEPDGTKRAAFPCTCDCGTVRVVTGKQLRRGTKSCGCLTADKTRERMSKPWMPPRGRLYNTWMHMVQRCTNPNGWDWKHYGGRGITVCDEWRKDYLAFHNWAMANGYSHDLEIDRRDNSQGYGPDNCRFVTHQVNCQNRRSRWRDRSAEP